jgi:hypothetical protein
VLVKELQGLCLDVRFEDFHEGSEMETVLPEAKSKGNGKADK